MDFDWDQQVTSLSRDQTTEGWNKQGGCLLYRGCSQVQYHMQIPSSQIIFDDQHSNFGGGERDFG